MRFASRLHLPSPISEANVDGIEAFEPMDTAADVALMETASPRPTLGPELHEPAPVEPRKLILIGSGRIGLVARAHRRASPGHGARRHRRPRASPRCGGSTALAGPQLATFTDLDEALRVVRPDAAIISTPPSSHVPLASKLLAAGVDVLVEKPVAATGDDRQALDEAVAGIPSDTSSTGYFAGLLPHLAAIAPDLRAGRFGTPVSFDAHAFVSRIEEGVAEQRDMWELDPSISGGGALVNLGVHVLAMLDVLLGSVEATAAALVTLGRAAHRRRRRRSSSAPAGSPGASPPRGTSPASACRRTSCASTPTGATCCARRRARRSSATARCTSCTRWTPTRGFDLAPMDAGGAFWAEQDLLASRTPGANSLDLANRVEDLITDVYRKADRIRSPHGRRRRARAPRAAGARAASRCPTSGARRRVS